MEKIMAEENAKSDYSRSTLKVQQRERENSLKGHYKTNQSFYEKKILYMENSLINKRLLKETYDKNAGQIQEVKKNEDVYQISFT